MQRKRFNRVQRWAPLAFAALAVGLVLCGGCASREAKAKGDFTSMYAGRIGAFGFGVAPITEQRP